ncbi:hypothetical protein K502DRAFT_350325 [Neoconidiobolus thromboides FSU 785]|nr:hypothetical protein K502DRAFT_350325 [Neoconidiobolus thromboides FSU 785]
MRNECIHKELGESLKTKFNVYRKVVSCIHLLDPDQIRYYNTALTFLMLNNEVLFNKLGMPTKLSVNGDSPPTICTYGPAKIERFHCRSAERKGNLCKAA